MTRRTVRAGIALLALALAATASASLAHAKPKPKPHAAKAPAAGKAAAQHIFVIMLENHSRASVIGDANAPEITKLAETYAQATRYYGVTHPSEPNYVAAVSGSTWDVNNDSPTNVFDHTNLVDQLEAAHRTWAAYMESMPSAGFLGAQYPANAALYAIKHNPFALFADVRDDPARLAHVKPYTALAADLNSTRPPDFVWISPNQCHDMHGGVSVQIAADGSDGTPCPYGSAKDDANDASLKQKADAFVKQAVDTIMKSKAWTGNSVIFVVADENDFTGDPDNGGWESTDGCCDSPTLPAGDPDVAKTWPGGLYGGGLAPAVVIARNGKRGYTSDTPYNHYSLLATIEQAWNLGYLGYASDRAQVRPMTEFLSK